jgi:hypothetical protein
VYGQKGNSNAKLIAVIFIAILLASGFGAVQTTAKTVEGGNVL